MEFNHAQLKTLAQQIVRTMGMEPITYTTKEDYIFMEDGWVIYLPEHDPSYVLIEFYSHMDPNLAADIAMRFCKITDALRIRVMVRMNYDCMSGIHDS